jgi:hypothetical protein
MKRRESFVVRFDVPVLFGTEEAEDAIPYAFDTEHWRLARRRAEVIEAGVARGLTGDRLALLVEGCDAAIDEVRGGDLTTRSTHRRWS